MLRLLSLVVFLCSCVGVCVVLLPSLLAVRCFVVCSLSRVGAWGVLLVLCVLLKRVSVDGLAQAA